MSNYRHKAYLYIHIKCTQKSVNINNECSCTKEVSGTIPGVIRLVVSLMDQVCRQEHSRFVVTGTLGSAMKSAA